MSNLNATTTASEVAPTAVPDHMQAIAYTSYGGPEVTEIITLPTPAPAAGQVLVRVAAGGLNPVDTHQRKGTFKMVTPYTFPAVAGNEFSGRIAALGEGVTGFTLGENVIGRVAKSTMGGLGQYVAIEADFVARAPTSIPLEEGAGLPLAGLTALQVLNRLDVRADDRLLITAGAGGVGLFAIQLAKLRGAHVTTTASPAGEELVRSVGADEVINYRTTKLATVEPKFTKVFDAAGGEDLTDLFGAVAKGGHVVTIGGPPTSNAFEEFDLPTWKHWLVSGILGWKSRSTTNAAHAAGIKYEYIFMQPNGKQLQDLSDLVSEGNLKITIDSRYPMKDFAKAFERLESRKSKGKVIIDIE